MRRRDTAGRYRKLPDALRPADGATYRALCHRGEAAHTPHIGRVT